MTEALQTHGQGQPTNVDAPRPSTINRADLSASLNRSRILGPRQIAARLVLATTLLGGGKLAMDASPTSGQEPSIAPSFGASFEPSASPIATDPITGLPCIPKPSAEPAPSESPTPAIGLVENQGQALAQTGTDVFVSAQAEPSALPTVAPEASGLPGDTDGDGDVDENDGETAANPNCEPADGTPWTIETPVQEEKIDYATDLDAAVTQFYVENPEVEGLVDDFGTNYPLRTAKKILKACKAGDPGDKNQFPGDKKRTEALIKSTRIVRCGSLSAEFYDLGTKYNNPGFLRLSRLVRDYALQSIKGNDVEERLYDQFKIYEDMGFFSIK